MAGEVLVGPRTLELLGETVRVGQRGRLSLKGVEEPVSVYAVDPL